MEINNPIKITVTSRVKTEYELYNKQLWKKKQFISILNQYSLKRKDNFTRVRNML